MMTAMNLSLTGRTALVSGACTGIGRAMAVAFAQAGAKVVINHLGQATLAHTLQEELRQLGHETWAFEADVSSSADVQHMAAQVLQTCGPLDVLVNNAGILREKPFLQTSEADWNHMLATDLTSVFLMCKAFLPAMVARQQGVIINIASDLGILGRGQFAPYCAAKAGVIGLTRSLAREFAPQIRVNAIAPGPVATTMVSLEAMSQTAIDKELEIPQHRIAEPQEIAATALFLASDLSRFYCGQVLGPNGGSVMP
ncbi:3-oxoacyl-[acyl-carrier-protein] reductase FabG [Rhodoferax lithotrophicus]|uniref:3-oxoacyl-[acyl-carrier-protein] reductase FabG n=2 Tax=Rhodoferax lithotrophicus TaxID=2798804 RepID=A0ABN6DA10_9BURK|nr:3-oxoacyl-[acyl-carrier-protein] reductase FabG [Rhodoferax sp. MIZ03]